MIWLWAGLSVIAALAGIRHRARIRAARGKRAVPRVDDATVRRILETGSLPVEDGEPLDLDAAARAEEEFWSESWDEPEEYLR